MKNETEILEKIGKDIEAFTKQASEYDDNRKLVAFARLNYCIFLRDWITAPAGNEGGSDVERN